jgi:AraC family transcriptional regulator, regulatory protein of adaptative response / methylated-DNA-[protein]-cysteine methyltransferase
MQLERSSDTPRPPPVSRGLSVPIEFRAQVSVGARLWFPYRPCIMTSPSPMTGVLPSPDEMYRALVRRDPAYEGVFYTAVKTTGIFCRPTCRSRKPRRDSVEFFRTPRECVLAGYRACKRCKPLQTVEAAPPWVEQLTQRIERDPAQRIRAADLRAMRIDPARASRWFKSHYGMTFQAYHRARRLGGAMKSLRHGGNLDRAGERSGYASLSGFRDAFSRTFGKPPGQADATTCLVASWLDTPLGPMLALANDAGLALLEFVDRRMLETQLQRVRSRCRGAIVPGKHAHLDAVSGQLTRYFAGDLRRFTMPLAMHGTDFQMKVWKRLLAIPYGQTLSYAAMARDIGVKNAQRAVGRANGDNRLAIIIPCHRVIRSDGTMCGYGGGLWRKKWLLEHERSHLPTSPMDLTSLHTRRPRARSCRPAGPPAPVAVVSGRGNASDRPVRGTAPS